MPTMRWLVSLLILPCYTCWILKTSSIRTASSPSCLSFSSTDAETKTTSSKQQTQERNVAVAHQIDQVSNLEDAVDLLKTLDDVQEETILAALRLCYRLRREPSDIFAAVYETQEFFQLSSSCRQLAIQVYGKCGNQDAALKIFEGNPTVGCLNALLACLKSGDEAASLLRRYPNISTTLSYNIVLGKLAKVSGQKAQDLLDNLILHGGQPDQRSCHAVIQAWLAESRIDKALQVKNNQMTTTSPNRQTFDLLIRGATKQQRWDIVKQLENERKRVNGVEHDADDEPLVFRKWKGLEKVKHKGQPAYWKLGTYVMPPDQVSITVGIQPNRNPRSNGVKLIFLKGEHRFAYMLLQNKQVDVSSITSSLLGLYIDPTYRKGGLTKHLLGIWLYLCYMADLRPRTKVMRKPLLAMVLQHTFGFGPLDVNEGVDIDIFPPSDLYPGQVCIRSTSKCLEGAFSPTDLKRESIVFCKNIGNNLQRVRSVRISAHLIGPEEPNSFVKAVGERFAIGDVDASSILLGVERCAIVS